MGVNLVCWKWKDDFVGTGDGSLISDVVRAFVTDVSHAAVDRFDVHLFEQALREEARGVTESELILSVSDFTGDSANCVMIEAGYDEAQRLLPSILRAAEKHGVVVYSDAEDRIVSMSDAMAGLASAERRDSDIAPCRDKFQAILKRHVAPAVARLEFKRRGKGFARVDADRVIGIFPIFEDWSRAMRIDASIGSLSLAQFLDDYRRFCQEPPLQQNVPTLALWNIGKLRASGGGNLLWKLNTEHDADAIGAHAASTMIELIGILSGRYPDLRSLADACGEGRDATIELASIHWLLGESEQAMRLVTDRLAVLEELIRTRYFPPDKGERVDLQFFKEFLEKRSP
jgi:hypothetical protein